MTRATGDLVGVQTQVIEQQSDRLARNQDLIGALSEWLVVERAARAKVEARLVELAGIVEALQNREGPSPEQTKLLARLEAAPELVAALGDPAVQALLSAAEGRVLLAQDLLDAARRPHDGGVE